MSKLQRVAVLNVSDQRLTADLRVRTGQVRTRPVRDRTQLCPFLAPPGLGYRTIVRIKREDTVSADIRTSTRADLYTELQKLKSLKDEGIKRPVSAP